jgi:hypothetical protein
MRDSVPVVHLLINAEHLEQHFVSYMVLIIAMFVQKFIRSFFLFLVGSQLEHRTPFEVSVISHTLRHAVGHLWSSNQPVAETSTYAGQHNIQTQETKRPYPERDSNPRSQQPSDRRPTS